MPKLIVIDQILIPKRNPRHALEHQGTNVMHDTPFASGLRSRSRIFLFQQELSPISEPDVPARVRYAG